MCTGITHVFRCEKCNGIVYILREATEGYTCYEAQKHHRRGICKTGIEYSYYDQVSDDSCLLCEIHLDEEFLNLTAETCDEGSEPWLEDREFDIAFELTLTEIEDENVPHDHMDEGEDQAVENLNQHKEHDDEDDEDDEEGGVKLY